MAIGQNSNPAVEKRNKAVEMAINALQNPLPFKHRGEEMLALASNAGALAKLFEAKQRVLSIDPGNKPFVTPGVPGQSQYR